MPIPQQCLNQSESVPVHTTQLDTSESATVVFSAPAEVTDTGRPRRTRLVQVFHSSCCDSIIDEEAKRRSDVVECSRKGCETRWVCGLSCLCSAIELNSIQFHAKCVGLDIHRPQNWVCDDCKRSKRLRLA